MRLLGVSLALIVLSQEFYVSAFPANYHSDRAAVPAVKSTSTVKTRSANATGRTPPTQVISKPVASSKTAKASAVTTPAVSSSKSRPASTALKSSAHLASVGSVKTSKSSIAAVSSPRVSVASSSLSHAVHSSSGARGGASSLSATARLSGIAPSHSSSKSDFIPISSFSSSRPPSITSAPLSSKSSRPSMSSINITSALINGEGAGTYNPLMGSTLYDLSTTDTLPSPSVVVSNSRRHRLSSDRHVSTVKPRTVFKDKLPTTLYHGTCKLFVTELKNSDKIEWEPEPNEFSYNGGFYLTTDRASAVAYVTSRNRACQNEAMGGWVVIEYDFDHTGLDYEWLKTEAEAEKVYNEQLTLGFAWRSVRKFAGEKGLKEDQLKSKQTIDKADFVYAARPLDSTLQTGSFKDFGTEEKPFDQVVIRSDKAKKALKFKDAPSITPTEPYAWCVDPKDFGKPECKGPF